MKKLLPLFVCAAVMLAAACTVWALSVKVYVVAPHSASLNADTTDSTPGDPVTFEGAVDRVMIHFTATGQAGTTNGTLTLRLAFSPDNVVWDTGSASTRTVTISTLGAATVTKSDWAMVPGARYVRVGQVENTFDGPVSGMAVKVTAIQY
jgi:hypothetical protein